MVDLVEVAHLPGVMVRKRDATGHRRVTRPAWIDLVERVDAAPCVRQRVEIEARLEPLQAERADDRGIVAQHIQERPPLLDGTRRVALHEPVGVVATQTRLHQREQHRLAEHEPVRRVEVRAHAVGVDNHVVDDAAELHREVVRELE